MSRAKSNTITCLMTSHSTSYCLDLQCRYFQWTEVPKSYNLGDDPNACVRVDTILCPQDDDVPVPSVVPWGVRKYFIL